VRIRWRLTWYGIGFTALSLVGFMLLILLLISGSAGDEQDMLLSSIADEAAESLSTVDPSTFGPGPSELVPDASTSDLPFLSVHDEAGRPVYVGGTIDGEPLDIPAAVIVEALETGASSAVVDGTRIQVRRWDGLGTGVVVAGQATRVVDEQAQGSRGFLIVFAVIALIAAAIGAWFMSGRALRPLATLAEMTDDIGRTGDLSRRLPAVGTDDEVGALTTSFNAMVGSLENARNERDATIEAQRRFIADASHELRSPLTSIRSNAGFLLDQPDADATDIREATIDIATESDRMGRLIDRLLTLARADLAEVESDPRVPVELSSVVGAAIRRARSLPVEITVEPSPPVVVEADREALTEAVWILIDNVARHGGTRAEVSIATDGRWATISVADDGPGIAPTDLDHVFERFYRADPQRSGPGHGLGLAIAAAIADRHSGTIVAEPNEPTGARFTISLPSP
jgi:signal transduction histidine kinase